MAPPESWQQNVLPFVWPILWILLATIAGVVVDRVFLVRLLHGRFMRRYAWIALGVDALRSVVVVWAVIFGIHAALDTSPLDRNAVHLLDDLLLVLVSFAVTVPLPVTYGSDLSLVERTATEIAGETLQRLGVANGTRHVGVRFQELSESSVRLTVSFPVPITVNQLEARSEFIKRIYDALALDTNKEAHLVGSTPAASS